MKVVSLHPIKYLFINEGHEFASHQIPINEGHEFASHQIPINEGHEFASHQIPINVFAIVGHN